MTHEPTRLDSLTFVYKVNMKMSREIYLFVVSTSKLIQHDLVFDFPKILLKMKPKMASPTNFIKDFFFLIFFSVNYYAIQTKQDYTTNLSQNSTNC